MLIHHGCLSHLYCVQVKVISKSDVARISQPLLKCRGIHVLVLFLQLMFLLILLVFLRFLANYIPDMTY